eukprot:10168146-Prorocentrum_lima.AAC.1
MGRKTRTQWVGLMEFGALTRSVDAQAVPTLEYSPNTFPMLEAFAKLPRWLEAFISCCCMVASWVV